MNDVETLATNVVSVLNGADANGMMARCAPGVTVFATIAEETIDPFARRDPSRLVEFVHAYHTALPDVRFTLVGAERRGDTMTVTWNARGTHRAALGYIPASGNAVAIQGTCVLRFAKNAITEVRLAADVYDLLLQTGALCADPGVARGRSQEVAAAAMASLLRAVTSRTADVAAPFDASTLLHASVRCYASAALDQATFDLDGLGQTARLLGYLREQFAAVEIVVDGGVSQGHTTTFRGGARVEREGEWYRYHVRCGFRAKDARIAESWIEIQLPPTLHEVFA